MNRSVRNLRLLAMILFACVSAYAESPINLRVVWTESPQTHAVVAWDCIGQGKGTLHLREAVEGAQARQVAAEVGEYPKAGAGEVSHCYFVALGDLKPSTKYFVVAQIDNDKSKECYFITAPDKDVSFKLFFAGDSRTSLDKTRAVANMIRGMFEKDPTYIGLLHGGDMADASVTKAWNVWLAAYALTTASDGRLLPIIPVRGNHEGAKGGLFDLAYGAPGEAVKNYYTCMLSPQVGIIVLNSMYSVEGDQKVFLEKSLAEFQKNKVRFQMAAYHIPLYPAIKAPHRAKQAWAPLFEKYNIDLGLESDGHCIKRTVPIRDDKKADDGVVYLGEGGFGAPQRSNEQQRWYLEKPGFLSRGDHAMVLSFTKESISYFTEQLDKGSVDSATFRARAR